MPKIFITGNAGSGKSTLSKKLGAVLNLPVSSLDGVVWKAGWQKAPTQERQQKIAKLLKQKNWIIEGVDWEVLRAADTIIFLDIPRYVCYWRVLKRNWRYLFRSRPELPPNCPEMLIIRKLISIIWNFPTKVRPMILEAFVKSKNKRIIHISNNYELQTVVI